MAKPEPPRPGSFMAAAPQGAGVVTRAGGRTELDKGQYHGLDELRNGYLG